MGTYTDLLDSSSSCAHLFQDTYEHNQNHPADLQKQRSIIDSNSIKKEVEEEIFTRLPTNVETKQEGTVKWHVYASYLKAGGNMLVSFLLIALFFVVQQTTTIFGNWWLARLNDDESQRHGLFTNCSKVSIRENNIILLMNDTEWNEHRNLQFYIYCGLFTIIVSH